MPGKPGLQRRRYAALLLFPQMKPPLYRSMKQTINSLTLAIPLALSLNLQAEPSNPNTDWFSQAKYGVFMHFLPSGSAGLKLVEQFDAKALANQLEAMGAGYFVLTLGQNSGYFNSPNAAYERQTGYAPGERCATRDLPRDLYEALHAKGIRLMLYLPCQTPNADARAQKAFGLAQGERDQPIDLAFAGKWSRVIQEWSDRYGEKVSGWWFDGGYEHIHFSEAIAARYAAAVKHGNPKAIVTFNPGVKVIRWTKAEDYTAGELNEPLRVIPADRWLDGSQWHALTYLGGSWMQRNTRFSTDQWVGWARKVTAHQGVFTLDMGPNYDPAAGPIGQLAEAQVKQVQAIRAALRPGVGATLPKRLKRAESFLGIHFDFHAGPDNLKKHLSEYPLIVVAECDYLEPAFKQELVSYVENGGKSTSLSLSSDPLREPPYANDPPSETSIGRVHVVVDCHPV